MSATEQNAELVELLDELVRRKIEISLGARSIVYRGPKKRLDVDIKDRIKASGKELTEFLVTQPGFIFPRLEISNPDVDRECVIKLQASHQRCGLYCLHPVTGFSSFYRLLLPGFGSDYPIYGINSVNVNFERPPCLSMEEMGRYYAEQIQLVQQSGPYYLCGYSMGGLVALETARGLLRRGGEVGLLAILDTSILEPGELPNSIEELPSSAWLPFIRMHAAAASRSPRRQEIAREFEEGYRGNPEFWRLSTSERFEYLSKDTKMLGEGQEPERLAKLFNSHFAHQVAMRYRPAEYHGKIVYFLAEEQKNTNGKYPHVVEWERVAKGIFEVIPVPGNHISMIFEEANAVALGRKLRAYLP